MANYSGPEVTPAHLVSCSQASLECAQRDGCGSALSKRCKNSLDILLRQKAAAKLSTCYCEGTEDFDCITIRRNTDVLCFGKKPDTDFEDNEIDVEEKPSKTGSGSAPLLSSSTVLVILLGIYSASQFDSM